VRLLQTLGIAQLEVLLAYCAAVVAHAEAEGASGGQIASLRNALGLDVTRLLADLLGSPSDAALLQALRTIDERTRRWATELDGFDQAVTRGALPSRRVVALFNIALQALSLFEVARIPAASPGASGPPPTAPAIVGISGGAAVARSGAAAGGALAETIKKLIAIGALDPALAAVGAQTTSAPAGGARPAPLRQDAPNDASGAAPTSGTPSGSAADAPATVEPARALNPDNVDEVITRIRMRRSLSERVATLIKRAAWAKKEKWSLPDPLRGEVAHILAGENLPHGSKGIDRVGEITEDRVATEVVSIKTHQPYAASLSKPGGFRARLQLEVDVLANLKGRYQPPNTEDFFFIKEETTRVLEVEVPPDTLGPTVEGRPAGSAVLREQFRSEAATAQAYARSKGIVLRFTAAVK
jgi:hypothetical protein